MQVKKFEAKSIKEAIDLVKFHLGPDAIILSAKENVKRFGLMGETSVEVTAAVSENRLRKKQFAERKLDTRSKERFLKATANNQKKFIDKVFDQSEMSSAEMEEGDELYTSQAQEQTAADANAALRAAAAKAAATPAVPRENGITGIRYADIGNDSYREGGVQTGHAPTPAANARRTNSAQTQTAAPAARPTKASSSAPQSSTPQTAQTSVAQTTALTQGAISTGSVANEKISALQSEISYLKGLLDRFQRMPQGFVSMHPGGEDGLPYELSFMFKKLTDAGMSHANVVEILKKANQLLPAEQKKKAPFVDGWVIKYLLDHLQIVDRPFKKKYQIFLGPTGQGKTSTVVKLACQLIMKAKKRVALISGDHVKVGAPDQFKIYAQILNAPYAMINSQQDWERLMPQLDDVDYVFVDTPGVNLKNPMDLDTIKNILPPTGVAADTHFVQSIMARDTEAFEIADRFRIIGFDDVIFTRLDEAVQHGLIYNFQKKFQLPLHSFGIGNSIPDDFEMATKERVVDLIFNLSNYRKESSKESSKGRG